MLISMRKLKKKSRPRYLEKKFPISAADFISMLHSHYRLILELLLDGQYKKNDTWHAYYNSIDSKRIFDWIRHIFCLGEIRSKF